LLAGSCATFPLRPPPEMGAGSVEWEESNWEMGVPITVGMSTTINVIDMMPEWSALLSGPGPFDHGHFAHFGPGYRYHVLRIDRFHHWFWFPGGFYFEIAPWGWPIFLDWCWNCGDDFVVFMKIPDHIGWYLLYNIHAGVYVTFGIWGCSEVPSSRNRFVLDMICAQ